MIRILGQKLLRTYKPTLDQKIRMQHLMHQRSQWRQPRQRRPIQIRSQRDDNPREMIVSSRMHHHHHHVSCILRLRQTNTG